MLALVGLAFGAACEGTPEFLKEQFGFFVGVDDYGPRAVITTPGGYVAVGDDAAKTPWSGSPRMANAGYAYLIRTF
jgi:hypothetical protein